MGGSLGQVLEECTGGRRILGHSVDCACTKNRVAEIGRLVRREVEEVGNAVLDLFALFREEGRNEGCLTVHHALRRRREQALRRVTEEGGCHSSGTAGDIIVIARELAIDLHRVQHFRAVERKLVRNPLVVLLGRCGAEHQVFHPVGGGPAGGIARLHADAPRGVAVRDHLVGKRDQLFHALRNLVAVILELLGQVPDERLQVLFEREAVEVALARRVGIGAESDPRGTGAVVVGHPAGKIVAKRSQVTFLGHVACKTRLRENGDVRRVVRAQIGHDQSCKVTRTGIFDYSTSCLFKAADGCHQVLFVLALHGAGDGDDLTLELAELAEL